MKSASPTACLNPTGGPHGPWSDVPLEQWNNWKWQQANRLRRASHFEACGGLSDEEARAFDASSALFHVGVTPYYASLMQGPGNPCPVRLQAVPQLGELETFEGELEDPLAEELHMPVPGITWRYPDRVLFYVTHNCPVYCRHCTRKRKVADPHSAASLGQLERAIQWLRENPQVRDVLVSGGDPLTLSDARLDAIFQALADIDHIEVFRMGTRNPVTLPQRITPELCRVLAKVRPLYLHTHFNHPSECTDEAARALNMLADAGANLGNQMVLMKGVNDDPEVVLELNRWLLKQRCRPYYIFQADMAQGISHLRTPLSRGLEIVDHLRGRISGMGVPHFAIDLPGGGGKITLTPDYLVKREGNVWTFRNGHGRHYEFHDIAATGESSK